jgi:hypothetical protein
VLEVGKILVDMGPGREPIDIVPYLADPDDDGVCSPPSS